MLNEFARYCACHVRAILKLLGPFVPCFELLEVRVPSIWTSISISTTRTWSAHDECLLLAK